MARIRTIKPEFWEDEKIGCLSHGARLLFLCSLNLSDDSGLLRWNAIYLASHAFTYDDIKLETIEKWMNELIDNDLVYVYRAGKTQQPIAWIINFLKHQKIDKPQLSKFQPPQDARFYAQFQKGSNSTNDSQNDSTNDSENDSQNDSTTEKEGNKGRDIIYPQKEIDKEKVESQAQNDSAGTQPKKEKSCAKKEKAGYDLSFIAPEYLEIFTLWMNYKKARKESYKSQQSLEQCYKNMVRDCGNDPTVAMEMYTRAVGNNWSGMFPPKKGDYPQRTQQKSEVEKAVESHNRAFGNKKIAF